MTEILLNKFKIIYREWQCLRRESRVSDSIRESFCLNSTENVFTLALKANTCTNLSLSLGIRKTFFKILVTYNISSVKIIYFQLFKVSQYCLHKKTKFIYTKCSKHYTVAHTFDCVCRKF